MRAFCEPCVDSLLSAGRQLYSPPGLYRKTASVSILDTQCCAMLLDAILCAHIAKNFRAKIDYKGKKVKFSHTRYRALGPELIPVYRQSARR